MARALVVLFLLASTCFAWEGGNNSPLTDAAATVGSLRTLGSGALQAMPGDSSPTPGAHRGSHYPGGSDSLADTFTVTTRSLTAGAYLTGGGDQSADRTVDLEIGSVSADVTPTWAHVQNKVAVNTGTYLSGGGSLSGNLTLDADIGDISASVTPSWLNLQGHPSVTAGSYLSGGGSLAGSVTLNVLLGDLSVDVTPTWPHVQGKPSTFPPVIGSGAGDAVAGNDARLTDTRNPTGTAGGVLTGTYPDPGLAATAVTPGTYTLPTITVAADGRLTGATNNASITQDASNNTTVTGNLIAGTLTAKDLTTGSIPRADSNGKLTSVANDTNGCFNWNLSTLTLQSIFTELYLRSLSSTAASGTTVHLIRARPSFAACVVDDTLGILSFDGYTNSLRQSITLKAIADSGWGSSGTDSPGKLILSIAPDGSSTPTERQSWDASGNVTITLGDGVGGKALMVADSTNTTVTRIDSDGNITTAGRLTSGTLTAGRVLYVGPGGKVIDSVALLFDGTQVTFVGTVKQANSGEILITNSGEYRITFAAAQPDTHYHLSLMSVDPSYGVPTDMRLTRETSGVTLTYTSANNVSLTYATMGY